MIVARELDKRLREAGLTINGVSLGKIADKKTWRVDFRGKPSDADNRAATAIIASFDPLTIVELPSEIDELKSRISALETSIADLRATVAAQAAPVGIAK